MGSIKNLLSIFDVQFLHGVLAGWCLAGNQEIIHSINHSLDLHYANSQLCSWRINMSVLGDQ